MSDLQKFALKSEAVMLAGMAAMLDLIVGVSREAGLPPQRLLPLFEQMTETVETLAAEGDAKQFLLELIALKQAGLHRTL